MGPAEGKVVLEESFWIVVYPSFHSVDSNYRVVLMTVSSRMIGRRSKFKFQTTSRSCFTGFSIFFLSPSHRHTFSFLSTCYCTSVIIQYNSSSLVAPLLSYNDSLQASRLPRLAELSCQRRDELSGSRFQADSPRG